MSSGSQRFSRALPGVGWGFRRSLGVALLLFTTWDDRIKSGWKRGRARWACVTSFALLSLMIPIVLTACGGSTAAASAQAITIKGTEFALTPNTVTLTVGRPVHLTLINGGTVDHDIKSALPIAGLTYQNADNPADEQADNSANGVLDVDYNVGTTAQVTFTPTQAGSFPFGCDVPGHAQLGMTGTFIVQPA